MRVQIGFPRLLQASVKLVLGWAPSVCPVSEHYMASNTPRSCWERERPHPTKIAHEKICSWYQRLVLRKKLTSHLGQNRGLGTSHGFGVKEIQIFIYWFNLKSFSRTLFLCHCLVCKPSLTSTEVSPKLSPRFRTEMNSLCGLEV